MPVTVGGRCCVVEGEEKEKRKFFGCVRAPLNILHWD